MVFWNSFGLLNQEFSLDSNTSVTYWTDLNEIFLQLSALHSICVENQSFTHMEGCMSLFSFSVAGFDLWKKDLHSVQLLFKASIGLCNFKT